MISWKQLIALPVIATMALWQLMHLGTWCTSCAQMHELSKCYCDDNREGTLFSGIIYIMLILFLWDLCTVCVSWITYDHLLITIIYIIYTYMGCAIYIMLVLIYWDLSTLFVSWVHILLPCKCFKGVVNPRLKKSFRKKENNTVSDQIF